MGVLGKVLMALGLCLGVGYAGEVCVNTIDGEVFTFFVDAEESLASLHNKLMELKGEEQQAFFIEVRGPSSEDTWDIKASLHQGGDLGHPRDYSVAVTEREVEDIRYIVTTLANKSLISIAASKSSLEAAGDRIDHLHPLRFLMTVFSDEELKVGIRNIRGRGWVWNHFTGGLKGSLSTEARRGNMRDAYVQHFADVLEVDFTEVIEIIRADQWDKLIDYLITSIPRKGDHDRYDM